MKLDYERLDVYHRMIGQLSDQVREKEGVYGHEYGYGYEETDVLNRPVHLTAASRRG